MMEQFFLEPVELTETELDVVAGGQTSAAAAHGPNASLAFAAATLSFTISGTTTTPGVTFTGTDVGVAFGT